jgi:PadR family transcriptional regulator PadR
MILKTLESMGPLHGYGIARRIEQTSGDALAVPYVTRAGRKHVHRKARPWEQTVTIMARFFSPEKGTA